MKVVHINEHLLRKGGVETYLLAVLPMLEERGVSTHVVYGGGDPALWSSSTALPGVSRASFTEDATAARQLRAILDAEQPDVVHVHNVQSLGVLRASVDFGRTVMTTHDFRSICPANTFFYQNTQEECGRDGAELGCFKTTLTKHCLSRQPHYGAYFYRRARWAMSNYDRVSRVIAPSGGARDRLLRAGVSAESVDVLPYFCPVEPAERPRALPKRPTITFMGRIARNKGHEYFVEALGLLPQRFQGVMVGSFDPSSEAAVRDLAEEHRCLDRLQLRPWASRGEVRDVLDSTTVFVFPSLWPETLGIVGLEAMARGVPVVGSDIGGVREWLEDGVNGRLVEPKAPQAIRDAVLDLTASEQRLNSAGAAGLRTIRSRFMAHQHVDRLTDIYARVAKGAH